MKNKKQKSLLKIQDSEHLRTSETQHFFFVYQSPKTKLFVKFQNSSIFYKSKTTYKTKKNVYLPIIGITYYNTIILCVIYIIIYL